ncbi:adenosylcobinamide-GDP ribazoletransferase [Roseibium sp. RKSG952]|uniref:adenosylcobinamide-GDP ribazoletransferase n=1 Tax=Roseibium sp. RKSG952 TaxID=2529384 RepID=UPI0012BCB033|nr:adenosylcobinamide-GDP ribazoletransferase [Roseibium sp. RKSG952]MTH97555.1 adenosylcobinamide-GDP ribazoletransferase [Roseibium sp. RKSG952]
MEQPSKPETAAPSSEDDTRHTPPVLRLVSDTALCVRFFSRLPLPSLGRFDDPAALPDFSTSARAAPLAGLVAGFPAAVILWVLGLTALPSLAAAFLTIAVLCAVTGALHEDGLSDVIDGFFGGGTPERRLEIMKDSRVGAFGALALTVSIGLKAALIAALLDRFGPFAAALLLLFGEAFSRGLMVGQWARLPAARPSGLGARFGTPKPAAVRHGYLTSVVLLIPVAVSLPLANLVCGLLLASLSAYAVGRLAMAKIGGQTGDVLGATQQVSAIALLIGLLIVS